MAILSVCFSELGYKCWAKTWSLQLCICVYSGRYHFVAKQISSVPRPVKGDNYYYLNVWENYLNKKCTKIINTPITQFKQEPNKCHSAIMYFAAYSWSVHRGQGGKMLIDNSWEFVTVGMWWKTAATIYWMLTNFKPLLSFLISRPSPSGTYCWFNHLVVSDTCNSMDVAHQAPLFMGFSRQEYWSGLPFPSPGDLPDPGIKPVSPALQVDSSPTELWGKPRYLLSLIYI